MVNRYSTFIKAINLTTDYFILNVSMVVPFYLGNSIHFIAVNNQKYIQIVLIFNLTWLLSANIIGLYENILAEDSISTFRNVLKTHLLFIGLLCGINIMVGANAYFITRGYVFYSSILFGFLLWSWKLIFLSIRKSKRSTLFNSRNVIIIGYGNTGIDLHNFFNQNKDRGYKLLGFFDDNPERITDKEKYLGHTMDCINYVLNNKTDEIFFTLPVTETIKIQQLLIDADKNLIRLRFVPPYYEYGMKQLMVQSFGHIPVISVRPEPLENVLNRFFKRAFDIGFSLFVLIFIFSWFFPIIALLIKTNSKGPVLFKQLRSGRDNRTFICYKFRSMKVNDESDEKQASQADHRVTKIGAFMRRTSIDELPQFFNVLIGNMSVVGPRPHMVKHTNQYAQLIDRYMVRHFLKPGITGWAQVQGYRGETRTTEAMLQRIEADVWYLENWSFLLDLKIIFLTVWNISKGEKNAY